jgi:hypothetical protein
MAFEVPSTAEVKQNRRKFISRYPTGEAGLSDGDGGDISGGVGGQHRKITWAVRLNLAAKACDYRWDIEYLSA